MSKLSKLVGGAAGLAMLAPVAANAIQVLGIEWTPGAILEVPAFFEGKKGGGPILAPGDELEGIFRIESVAPDPGVPTWQDGDNGRELTGYFDGFIAEDIIAGPLGTTFITFSGGRVTLYSDSTPNFDASGGAAVGDAAKRAAAIATATDGDEFLNLVGSPIGGFGGTILPIGTRPITLLVTLTGGGLSTFATNIGAGLLDVDTTGAGAANSFFDTDTFPCTAAAGAPCPDTADKSFGSTTSITPNPALQGVWFVTGGGSIKDFSIPEPGILALLGLGFGGLGVFARRRATKV